MLKRGFQFAPGYRLQEFLGRGQFGQVWRATAPGGTATAVKFIDLTDGQGQKEYDAVKRVKQVRHANLMPITAIWLLDGQGQVIEEAPDEAIETINLSVPEAKGQSAICPMPEREPSWLVVAMLLGGKSLLKRLRECVEEGLPGIPPKELISYMDESAKGIDFLNKPQHDLGQGPIAIQHSDIKPANIVLIGSSAVVCDFGLARILTRNQVTATSASGTPAYMAPEAISGKPSRTSDQYSLAVTYYHLRTGTLPFHDGSLWEVLDVHRRGKLKFTDVPQAEREVLRKATDLNWENRFESSVEMVDALREALRLEGHTKPSFLPDSRAAGRVADSGGDTKAVADDLTATLDVPFAVQPTQPALESGQPNALADQGQAAADVGERESFLQSVKSNPKLMASIAGGSAILLLIAAVTLGWPDSNSNLQPDRAGRGGRPPHSTNREIPTDPNLLLTEAIASLESDEQTAIERFRRALAVDPSLFPEPQALGGHEGPIMKMVQSPDGTQLVSMADGPTALLWNLLSPDQEPTRLAGHTKLLNTLAISPDGQRLLTGGWDDIARVWNLKAADVASSAIELNGHQGKIEAVAWHPTQPIAVTASSDLHLGIWELGKPRQESPQGTVAKQRRTTIQETLTALASSSDGTWLAARTVGADLVEIKVDVLVFSWQELIEVDGSPPPIRLAATSAKRIAFLRAADDDLLVTGDVGGTISIYSIADQGLRMRLDDAHDGDVEAMRVVQADRSAVIVTGASDGSVHWWKYGGTSEQKVRLLSPDWGISCVDVSRSGRWVAAGDNQGSVWLWDTGGDQPKGVFRFSSGASSVDSILIDVDSRWLIAGCSDGIVRIWDLSLAKLTVLSQPTLPQEPIDGPSKTIDTIPAAQQT